MQVQLEVPGPDFPRPSIHIDPEEACARAGLEGRGF